MSTYTARSREVTARPRSQRLREVGANGVQTVSSGGDGSSQPRTWEKDVLTVDGTQEAVITPVSTPLVSMLRFSDGTHIVTISLDQNGYLHIDSGLWSDGFISALGANTSGGGGGGGGGIDADAMWGLLQNVGNSEKINIAHLPTGTTGSSVALGNHTHSQYLTAITKAMVEAVLTGDITSHSHTFANITSKPTTLAGYGITDAVQNEVVAAGDCNNMYPSYVGLKSYRVTNGAALANAPFGQTGFMMIAGNWSGYQMQLAMSVTSARMYYRYCQSGTWSAWSAVAQTSDITFGNLLNKPTSIDGYGIVLTAANMNTLINLLSAGSDTPTDDDYMITQFVGGGNTTTSYYRRKIVKMWEYIVGKMLSASSRLGKCDLLTVSINDGWSDGTNTHVWYGYDHRYPATGVYSTSISDYFGLCLRTASGGIYMQQNGNVGVGTSSPAYKLDVAGSHCVRGTVIGYQWSNSRNMAAFTFDKPGANATGIGSNNQTDTIHFGPCDLAGNWVSNYNQIWEFQGTVHTTVGIYSDGYVSALGQNASDIRLKRNIRDFEGATAMLMRLRFVAFQWNDEAHRLSEHLDTEAVNYGLVAQEAEEAGIDGLVYDMPYGDKQNRYKGIRYEKLIPIMAATIQQQQRCIDDLEARLARLEEIVKRVMSKE